MESANKYLRPVARELGLTSERFEHKSLSESAEYYIKRTKRKERKSLSPEGWRKEGYAKKDICERLLKECPDEIERVDCEDLSVKDFIEKYESKNKPVIIRGLTKGWKTDRYWTLEEIYQRYKDDKLKVGEDDEGYPIRIRVKYFFEYLFA